MKSCIIVFPASNCDRDVASVLRASNRALARGQQTEPALSAASWDFQQKIPEANVEMIWHADATLPKCDLVVLPGGFSYGDYLRSGAMAAHSPIMREVVAHARRGGLVLGICNGFQILTEAGLLPGVLMRNAGLKFICKEVHLRVENAATPFTKPYTQGQVVNFPVAHHDGNYFCDADTLKSLEDGQQIAFRYCTQAGHVTPEANPNGSLANIAGVFSAEKNVLGLMPHPERHAERLTGGIDGAAMFETLAHAA